MAYEKTNWTSTTPINTTNLNKIEDGISANDTANTNNTNAIETINTNIGNLSDLTTPTKGSLVGAINSIVESGSNSNGSYIKFEDGTQVCWKQVIKSAQINKEFGNLYETANTIQFGNYANPFIDKPIIFGYCPDRTALLEGIQDYSATSFGGTWLMRPSADATANQYKINLLAIGKWK